jgi:RND family efflux transporter MFP subunit
MGETAKGAGSSATVIMNKKLVFGCLPAVLISGALAWAAMGRVMRAEPTPPRLAAVTRGDVEVVVTETGAIEALKKVEVKSKVGGRLSKLFVQEGQAVRAGQALAEIDPTEMNSQVAQMQAQVDAARARLQQAERAASYQGEQTVSGVEQQIQAVKAAEARLAVAVEEDRAQPALTASDLAQAEAALQTAKDSVELMKTATHPQAVVAAESGHSDAKASAENARRNLERQESLFKKGFVSEQVVDTARAEVAAANARRDQAKKRLDLIQDQNRLELAGAQNRVLEAEAAVARAKAQRSILTVRAQEVEAARAAVAQARAQLALARRGTSNDAMRRDEVRAARAGVKQIENQLHEVMVHQGDTRIVASMDGVVTRRYIETGELVTSGIGSFSNGTPILQVSNLSRMLVKMTVNEVDVHKVRPGLPVEITVDGARGVKFLGTVSKVAPAAGSGTGQEASQAAQSGAGGVIKFAVEVVVDRPDARLKPGMSARCTVVMARRKNVVRIPADAVVGDGASGTVQVATEMVRDGGKKVTTFASRSVTVGLRGDSHVEILSGLREGEKVKPGIYTGPPRKALNLNFD